MTDPTTDRHTCSDRKAAAGPAWECPRCSAASAVSLPPAEQTALRDRAALSAKLWEIAERHIVAEWICCDPLEPGHDLCAKGYAALGMVKSLLVDADPGEAWNPSAPLLDALAAVLPATTDQAAVAPPPVLTEEGRLRVRVQVLEEDAERDQGLAATGARCLLRGHQGQIESGNAIVEGHRFALSVKLGLGTGAPWDAIYERVADLSRMADETPAAETEAHVCKPDAIAYYCPTSGETESNCHSGFDACCDRPDLHQPTAGERQAEAAAAPCVECGHPKAVHGEGEDPVTPGQCADCPEDEDRHDYRTAAVRQDGAQQLPTPAETAAADESPHVYMDAVQNSAAWAHAFTKAGQMTEALEHVEAMERLLAVYRRAVGA
ncbi:hypothetical protein ABZ784_28955 [Streptomyces tendae]|uniref:hypothetical protein n=1 Tax=Streptomyces tendae TaxID=1932 RepID=UPI0033E3362F